jgi:hypothetical protein
MGNRRCQRCPQRKARRAVVAVEFAVGDDRYTIAMCGRHRDEFVSAVAPWERVARYWGGETDWCGRCGHEEYDAVAVRHFALCEVDQERSLGLCELHRVEFDRCMKPWTQVATVHEPEPVLSSVAEANRAATARIRELSAAARKAVAGQVVTAPKLMRRQASVADTWTITRHAHERAGERGFTAEQMLEAAVRPEIQRPSTTTPGTFWRVLGDCAVSVNPEDRAILTVVPRFEFFCLTTGEVAHV